ncbi:MAG: glycosyltransferase family 2 protein [Cardiobacteriaceae bacterium]|nr:glycosyltransferase family 2 protein [Cardiobacteriaceae bacterium]
MYRLSVVMIVKNEAHNLRRSLAAIAPVADEIVILDSGSSDGSESVAREHGANWHVNTDWQGFGIQRQRAQALATGDWILALDADETPDAALLAALEAIKNEAPGDTVYGIRRLDDAFGHLIDHPRWRIKAHWRLYPRRFGYNANAVHESVALDGAQTAVLPGFLHHHTADTPHFWLDKRLQYAHTWAQDRAARGKNVSPIGVLLRSLWAFLKQYFADGRFLQGRHGWIYAWLFAQYTFNKYALLNDMRCRPQSYRADFEPHDINRHHLPPRPPAPNNPHPLSAVLIVKNEARHLPACLASIADLADEIVILDSGSTDESEAIARHFGAKWHVNTDWQGFGIQRQRAQALASGEWILAIDADEQPDDALKAAIREQLRHAPPADRVFAPRRVNIFCGARVYAWYCDHMDRLYGRDFHYHPYEVHESLDRRAAQSVILSGALLHFTNDNLWHFLRKKLQYSDIWAQEKARAGKKAPNLWLLPLASLHAFVREYLLRGAFYGGRYGFYHAASTAAYHFNKYLMLAFARHKT